MDPPNGTQEAPSHAGDAAPQTAPEPQDGKLALLGAVLETNVHFDPRLQAERLNAAKGKSAREGFCVECEDQAATVACNQCNDNFCFLCYQSQHRKGKRAAHTTKSLVADQPAAVAGAYLARSQLCFSAVRKAEPFACLH